MPGIRMRIGYRLRSRLTQPTPNNVMLNVRYPRFGDLERADWRTAIREGGGHGRRRSGGRLS